MICCSLRRVALPTLGVMCVVIAIINFLVSWNQVIHGLDNAHELDIKKVVAESLNLNTIDNNRGHNSSDVSAPVPWQILESLPLPDGTMNNLETIWPTYDVNGTFIKDDRILAQLQINPPPPPALLSSKGRREPPKVIYVPSGLGNLPKGHAKFESDRCPVNTCSLTSDSRYENTADVQLLHSGDYYNVFPRKPHGQIWVLYILESPMSTYGFSHLNHLINWTATYRTDSTLVTPYEKYVPYDVDDFGFDNTTRATSLSRDVNRNIVGSDYNVRNKDERVKLDNESITGSRNRRVVGNYADGKTRMIAWFVSNCRTSNRRWEYMEELRLYVPVDVYGACGGEYKCPRVRQKMCDKLLSRDYKFYLAFENSNCRYYITEKFFQNALWNNIVPIVMGAQRADYQAVAPPHSYIHVEDFSSPRELANYLIQLNATDSLYNEYFGWKSSPGRFINTYFWCRLCAMLNSDVSSHVSWYDDVDNWWRTGDTCTNTRWDESEGLIASSRKRFKRYFSSLNW